MKRYVILVAVMSLLSCGNKNKCDIDDGFYGVVDNDTLLNDSVSNNEPIEQAKTHKQIADKYIDTITGFTCVKAMLTDNDFLVIAIDAVSDRGYDILASQFLDEAKSEGLTWIKGVRIVDSKNCEFQQGTVIGDRIGAAYNN